MIGNEMAVRQGDILIGAGPPDPVLTGCSTVLIGDVGFGLADRNNMKEFCEGFATLVADWSSLTPEERRSRLQEMANDQLAKSGLPPQDLVGKASLAPGNAQYSFRTDTLELSEGELNAATLTASAARTLANTLYHEARHAEQWYLIARRAAGQGQTAAQIQSNLGVTSKVASSAAENPLSGMSAQGNLAKAANVSVYGSRRTYRNAVLGDVGRRYEEYRALPEEQDAWNTGDSLPCGSR